MPHAWPYRLCRGGRGLAGWLIFIGVVIAIWGVGRVFAWQANATGAYYGTTPAYLGIAGIISVWLATIWADGALNDLVERVPAAFADPDEARGHLTRARSRMMSSWSLVGAVIATILLVLFLWRTSHTQNCGSLLPAEWYETKSPPALKPHDWNNWTAAIFVWYGIPTFALLSATINGAFWFSVLTWRLSSLAIVQPLGASVHRLRAVVAWGRTSGIWWSISGITVVLLLRPAVSSATRTKAGSCVHVHSLTLAAYNAPAVVLGAFATIWALVLLVIPYLFISRAVSNGVSTAVEALETEYPLDHDSRIDPRTYAHAVTTNQRVHDGDVLADAWSRIGVLDTPSGGIVVLATQFVLPWLPLAAALIR